MPIEVASIQEAAEVYANRHPRDILAFAIREFSPRLAISFSGAEDVVLIDLAVKILGNGAPGHLPFGVFSLDTGRLHPETYRFLDQVQEHYQIAIQVFFPEAQAVEKLVSEKGLFSFYRDGHQECCGIRKVEPLRRALASLDAWVTGQRRDQSPGTRAQVPVIQIDSTFSSPDRELIKFNPLANWTSEQVWAYIRENGVPYNPLHDRGFISIGCEPCTRPVLPGQHEREGRWWWEDATKKECGLHGGNVGK
jgi:phosphoadenosine phosphosulfate reductase